MDWPAGERSRSRVAKRKSRSSKELTTKLRGTRSAYRAEFLALLDHVRTCLAEGHSVQAIYDEALSAGDISCAYETFRRYVRRYLPDSHR